MIPLEPLAILVNIQARQRVHFSREIVPFAITRLFTCLHIIVSSLNTAAVAEEGNAAVVEDDVGADTNIGVSVDKSCQSNRCTICLFVGSNALCNQLWISRYRPSFQDESISLNVAVTFASICQPRASNEA